MNLAKSPRGSLIAAAVTAVLLTACSSVPSKPEGAVELRSRLTQLQADPQLAGRAPLAMEQATLAVTAAEQPQSDRAITDHLNFMADRKISIATADAHNQWSVDQRPVITEQRTTMQLQARTAEADAAGQRTAVAQADADSQRQQADFARESTAVAQADADNQRRQADDARDSTVDAQRNAADLQQQIVDLQARPTDRGLVLTLGDVLFASGTANLNSGGTTHLDKLAGFLNKYEDRSVQIEGYTDSNGSDEYNQSLSQRRAEAVRAYLVNRGVGSSRLTASGKGESSPVGDNGTDAGRQQNRRVEVIIGNGLVSAR
jgi:outer membrane protein OmpA-like peptidoglycan-associated protein